MSSSYDENLGSKVAGGIGCLVIALVVGIFALIFSLKIVGPGEIGVVVSGGAVNANEKGPGVSLVMPFIDNVVSVDGRIQGITFENLAAASKEYQDVFLTGTLNVHVQPDKAAELYQTVGLDYKDKLVVPFYTNIVKEVVPQYLITEILPKREEIRKQTVERLASKLAPYGIIVDDVALANINFNDEYNKAIQDKQIQELRVQTEKNILLQKQIQKDQTILDAQAQAQAQIERAKGESESNRLISQSLTAEILQNRYIEKLADKIQVILVPSDGNFLLNPKDLTAQQPQ